MPKLYVLSVAVLLTLSGPTTSQEQFKKYRRVEAYEVRPGILMMPRYSADGQVCEIALEKLHFTPEVVRLESDLSRQEINQIFDELVPADEKGKPTQLATGALITEVGRNLSTKMDFENVSVEIYGATSSLNQKGKITVNEGVTVLKWKKLTCQF